MKSKKTTDENPGSAALSIPPPTSKATMPGGEPSAFSVSPLKQASNSTASNSTASNSTASDSTAPDSTASDSTASDSTAPDFTASDSTVSDSTASDSTASDSTALSVSPPKTANASSSYVTQLTTVASFGLDVAALFTSIGFGAAKLGTGLGLNIAKQSVGSMAEFFMSDPNGSSEDSTLLTILGSPIGLGLTVATSTLTFAEFLALSGIQWTHNAVNTGLVAARESIGVLDKFFGSNDTARCLAEFVALVKREWAVQDDDPHVPPNFGAFTMLGTMKALVAWIALQAVTAERWNERVMKHVTQIDMMGSNSAIHSSRNSIMGFNEDPDEEDNEETMHITRTERKSGSDGKIVEGDILNRGTSRGSLNPDFQMTPMASDETLFETPKSTMSSIYYPFHSHSNHSAADEYNRQLLHNLKRYSKFSLGAYGRDALGYFGVTVPPLPQTEADDQVLNPHHFTFAHHTKTRVEYVSGFSQQQGTVAATTEEKIAPSYYLIRDHNSSSIILALRGTFSLVDLVVDLTCEDMEFKLPSELEDPSAPVYTVHSGMCTAARDLVIPGPGTVFNALKKALEENQGYGLVIVGHSLGAAIGSLLALLLASPNTCTTTESSGLPPNRPVHAFAFAAPCAMSAPLSRRAERLITSLVYADDVITRLSVGAGRDLRNIAAWLVQGDKDEPLYANIISKAVSYQAGMYDADPTKKAEIKNWFFSLRTTLHANMQHDKLYPGGTIYWVLPVNGDDIDPDADARSVAHMNPDDPEGMRYKLYKIDDVEEVLSEIIFSRNMLFDHLPTQYEDVISYL